LIKDSIGLAKVYNNIGVLYEELLKEDDSALLYYRKALPIFIIKSKSKAATTYNNIAKILIHQKKYSLAEEYLNKAVSWNQEEAENSIKAHLLRNFGELYIAQKKYDKAREVLVDCYQLFSANGERKKVLEVYSLLSQLSYYQGEYILAATYMTRYTNLKDTLLSIENRKLVAQMEGQYQLQEKNKAIKLLKLKSLANQRKIKMRNIITFSIISILLLIIALFYLYFRKEKLVQSQMRLELQNYLLEINHYKQAIEVSNKQKEELSRNRFKEFELTEREGDILLKIAQGLTNAEIAEALFLSTNTIKTHIKNIYIKLDVKNRVEAVRRIN
jgi:DNA-binding CsgD family transcriptional regulator